MTTVHYAPRRYTNLCQRPTARGERQAFTRHEATCEHCHTRLLPLRDVDGRRRWYGAPAPLPRSLRSTSTTEDR
jgi:hypothetical protein